MPAKKTACLSAIAYVDRDTAQRLLDGLNLRYALIYHLAEDQLDPDESIDRKDHCHILIDRRYSNANLVQQIKREFCVDTGDGHGSASKIMGFRDSLASQWHQYVLHDIKYLSDKGLTKQYHYTDSDLVNNGLVFDGSEDFCSQSQKTSVSIGDIAQKKANGELYWDACADLPVSLYPSFAKLWSSLPENLSCEMLSYDAVVKLLRFWTQNIIYMVGGQRKYNLKIDGTYIMLIDDDNRMISINASDYFDYTPKKGEIK